MDGLSALLFLVEKHDLLPTGIPAVIADQVSQGEHRVEMMLCPAQAGAFNRCCTTRLWPLSTLPEPMG
jgi:hypothetical protein